MQNSKLLEVLRTFSGHEWKSFKAFVDSPYFNRNPDVAALCRWLADQCGSGGEVHRESGFHALFPDQPFDDARWNHLMSFLLKLAEQFLGLEQYVKESFAPRFFILQALAERGLEKHYRYIFDQTRKKQAVAPYQDAAYFLQRYQLENYEANLLSRSAIRRFNESAQISTDNLDQFYLAEKLRYTCFMLTSQVVLATPYNFQLVEEVSRFVAGITDAAPVVQAYYRIYKLLSEDIATDHFDALRRLLAEQEQMFDRQVLAELYQYAINYCNLQIMKNREPYVAEALDLYQTGIQSGILLENGNLSPWHFKNIIKLGLRLKRYAWTEQFILDHNRLLEPEFREDAVYYNLAELYYYTGRYDEALVQLNKVEFTDVHYNLGAKVILAKIYYETDETDALDSLLHAFRTYLHRNRVISDDLRKPYLHFTALLRHILRSTPDAVPALREKVRHTVLAEKAWLSNILTR
jgi:hypothetical protein